MFPFGPLKHADCCAVAARVSCVVQHHQFGSAEMCFHSHRHGSGAKANTAGVGSLCGLCPYPPHLNAQLQRSPPTLIQQRSPTHLKVSGIACPQGDEAKVKPRREEPSMISLLLFLPTFLPTPYTHSLPYSSPCLSPTPLPSSKARRDLGFGLAEMVT